jgi:hypothetical protein
MVTKTKIYIEKAADRGVEKTVHTDIEKDPSMRIPYPREGLYFFRFIEVPKVIFC